jgi:hypothetical protein
MNNKYRITVQHPLLRSGLRIETEASERYVVPVVKKVMEIIREINNAEASKEIEEKKSSNLKGVSRVG